ncbi:MAG: hypothetical protein ABSF33_07570 [Acidimicrobiales bacterium]|jgi:hypothetical protein
MRRQVRSIIPFTGSNRVLRFSGRSKSAETGHPEKQDGSDEDELHRALGRVAANWSLIEIASGLVLMSLVGSRDEALARAVVAGQRVENVWETIESLLSSYGDDTTGELADFRVWRRSANKFRRRRNEAIHSAWSLTSGAGGPSAWDVMSQKAKRGARADLFPGGVAELEELARDIAACEEQLTIVHAGILTVMDRRDWARRDPP